MENVQLPKATMISFIKKHSQTHHNPDFNTRLLVLSKLFIKKISDKANQMCIESSKKTISVQHLEAALTALGLNQNLEKLKELGTNIKEANQLKRQLNQKIEQNIQKELREQRQRRMNEEPEKKAVVNREKFNEIEAVDLDGQQQVEIDYENLDENDI